MRVIYTSKGMSKKFGVRVTHYVRVIYRKIRYLKCPKIHYRNQCPPLARVLKQINPAHWFQVVFVKIHLNIIYPSMLRSSKRSLSSLKNRHGSLTEVFHGKEVQQHTD